MRPPKRAVPRVAIFTSQNQIQSTELSLPPFSFRKWLSWVYWKFVRFNQPWGTGESFDPPGEWTFEAPPDLWRLPHTMSNMTTRKMNLQAEKWPMYTLWYIALLREALFLNVLFPYGHCPNSFRPPPPPPHLVKRATVEDFLHPIFHLSFYIAILN